MDDPALFDKTKTTRLSANSTHLFIADAHLGAYTSNEKNKQLEESLISLVEYCRKMGYYLHILGDLFDYWMEYPGRIPSIGTRLREVLKKYHQQLGPTLYITGNHDNWDWQHFRNLGFDVEHEYRLLEFDNIKLLALHGDGLHDKRFKLPRPLLHRLLRNRYFINFFQTIFPPKTGWTIMKLFSRSSRWGEIYSMERKQHKLNEWAKQCLLNNSINGIIFGHDHKPRKYKFGESFFINPGSYELFNSLVMYTSSQFKIVNWIETEGLSETTKKYYINQS